MATTKTKYRRTSKGFSLGAKGLAAKVALVEKSVTSVDLPDFAAGDTVRVHVRIKEGEKERLQAFEGLVIAKGNHGGGASFTVRKISHGVGVERIFLENSQKIGKLEIVEKGRVRRAKLYYIRGLEGKAAKIERSIDGVAGKAASAAAKTAAAATKEAKK